MAATAPKVPSAPLTPDEAIDALAGQMSAIVKRLVARVETVEAENLKVKTQLHDALDAVEEMRGQIRTKDEIIAELQGLVKVG